MQAIVEQKNPSLGTLYKGMPWIEWQTALRQLMPDVHSSHLHEVIDELCENAALED